MFVTHGADLHPLVPLSVSLGEELHHDAVRPLPVKLQRFGWVAQVGTVDHVLQDLEETRSVRLNNNTALTGSALYRCSDHHVSSRRQHFHTDPLVEYTHGSSVCCV